ncbi:hypothetical protein ACTFIZ_002128 [Dictyostelium cf. discoideum]
MSSPKFDSYDWENDPNWKEFTGTSTSINKLKEEYFKKNIDPNYKSSNNNNTTTQRPSASTSSPRTSSTSSTSTTTTRPKPTFRRFLYGAWVIAQTSVIFFTLFYFISGNPYFFYKALLGATIAYSIPIFNTFEGRKPDRALAAQLVQNENAQFVFYCMIFYFLGSSSLVYLLPNFIYSFFHILKLVIPYTARVPFIKNLLEKVNSTNTKAIDFAISVEINIVLIAFFGIFSSFSNILLVFIYFRYLKLRYQFSQKIKSKINEYSQIVDQLSAHPSCPTFIRNIIPKIKMLLSPLTLDACCYRLFCLPECFAFISGGIHQFESRDNAEYLDQKGGIIERYKDLAKQNNIWLSLGGFHEKIKDDPNDMIYNTHLIIDSNGVIISEYRKMHLFDVDIPSKGVKMNESKVVKGGNDLVVCDSPVGKLGLSICYDLRFPELYLSLRRMDAQILLVPSAFMKSTDHHSKRSSYGHSMIIDLWGKVLHDLPDNVNDIAFVDIDLDYISTCRENIPVFNHKKLNNYKI